MNSIKVHVMHCGMVCVDEALPFRDQSRNPIAYTGLFRERKHKRWLPVSAYLIEHPSGNVLVDTGWDVRVRDDPGKALGFFVSFASTPKLPAKEGIAEQLLAKGISPAGVEYVILTHLDADHAGGLHDVCGAKHFLVHEDELNATGNFIRYNKRMWRGVPLQTFRPQETGYGPHGQSLDLFGDDTIHLIYLPGHSRGMTGVLIQNEGRFALLTGDCGYAVASWEEMRLPGIVEDKREMLRSLAWVKEMTGRPGFVRAFANHDPQVNPTTITL